MAPQYRKIRDSIYPQESFLVLSTAWGVDPTETRNPKNEVLPVQDAQAQAQEAVHHMVYVA